MSNAPVNLEAEQALIGALLHTNGLLEKCDDYLKPEHFSSPIHGKVYSAIATLVSKGYVANPITLKEFFSEEDLKTIGGVQYLVELADSLVTLVNAEDYAKIVYDLHVRRQLIEVGHDIVAQAQKGSLDTSPHELIDETEGKLFNLATHGTHTRSFHTFNSVLTDAIEEAEIAFKRDSHVVGVTTGLRDLDKWLGGLHPSDLIILAGRPSMGKTGLATNIAFNAALAHYEESPEGGVVAFFSLEMSAQQLATRILSHESRVPSDKIRRGELRNDDFLSFVSVSEKISKIPLYIDDTAALSVGALRTRIRRLKRQHDVHLVVIDYLQLLTGNSRGDNRVQEISEISRSLKAIAKEFEVPVVALSQLSRAVEQRDDKKPQLSDLRESGSIEQDADVVLFIYREEYYESRKEPEEGTEKHQEWQQRMSRIYNQADIIIAKQRHGPIGSVKLFYEGKLTKFGDLAKNHAS